MGSELKVDMAGCGSRWPKSHRGWTCELLTSTAGHWKGLQLIRDTVCSRIGTGTMEACVSCWSHFGRFWGETMSALIRLVLTCLSLAKRPFSWLLVSPIFPFDTNTLYENNLQSVNRTVLCKWRREFKESLALINRWSDYSMESSSKEHSWGKHSHWKTREQTRPFKSKLCLCEEIEQSHQVFYEG